MTRIKIFGILSFSTLLLLLGATVMLTPSASASRGTSSFCTNNSWGIPNDTSFFPFRFICGSSNASNTTPRSVRLSANVNGSNDPSNPNSITSGTNLSFSGGWSTQATSGTNVAQFMNSGGSLSPATEVLVWATIDGNNSLLGPSLTSAQDSTSRITISNSTGADNGKIAQCPGANSGMYSIVYNHRDRQPGGSPGFNQSPAAWNGSEGKEDCGTEGKMVYWRNASQSTDYGFDIDLPDNVEGQICVRLNVSIQFRSTEDFFLPDDGTLGPNNNGNNDQNSTASHVVQQSNRHCYYANNLPAPVVNASCDYYQRSPLQSTNAYTVYRFSYFSMDQPHVTAVPTSPSIITGALSAFPWQTFNATPIAQQIVVSTTGVSGNTPPGYVTYSVGPSPGNTPGTFTFRYPNPSGPDRLLYIESWENTGSSNEYQYSGGEGSKSSSRTQVGGPCYAASCSINVDPEVVANPTSVIGGDQIDATVTLRNGGFDVLRTPISGATLGVVLGGTVFGPSGSFAAAPYKLNATISGAAPYEVTIPIKITAPNSPGTFSISGYPAYYNTSTSSVSFSLYGFRGGGGQQYGLPCTSNLATVSVKVPFKLIPNASLTKPGSDENPGTLTYLTYIDNQPNPGVTVSAPQTSVFQRSPGTNLVPGSPNNTTGPFDPGNPASNTTLSGIYNIPTLVAGDEYCARITLTSYNTGFIASGGVVVDQRLIHDPDQDLYITRERCFTVKNWPYFKVQKTSIEAGGDFSASNPTCNSGGTLASWNNNNGVYSHGAAGSGANFTALARGTNIGVASAVDTTTPIQSPLGLSFANTGVPLNAAAANSPVYGGNYGGQNCLTDFTAPSTASADVEEYSANTPVAGRVINAGEDKAVYVTGDVYIENNITFGGSTNWSLTGVNKVPSFILKASGNIYVAPGVTQLDGVYLAGGTFYSCGLPSYAPVAKDNLFSSCKNQLTVVGMVIAKKINFMRTYGSLRDGGVGAAATNSCSNAGTRVPNGHLNNPSAGLGGNALTCAAEVFRFSPEAYLGEDVRTQPQNNGAIKYDAITGLPPIL